MPPVTAKKTGKGISGSTLKLIAVAAMTIDHFAAIILDRLLFAAGYAEAAADVDTLTEFVAQHKLIYYSESILRCVGRIAFPIFCFLLVEGYINTSDKKKYAIRLGVFALISEVPFDLAFSGSTFDMSYQNVFFTLLLGLLLLMSLDKMDAYFKERETSGKVVAVLKGLPLLGFCIVATVLRTDYSAGGIIMIALLYYLIYNPLYGMGLGCLALSMMSIGQIFSFLAMLPVHHYNGKRGLKLKYIFYVYYPLHILIFYLIAYVMGLSGVTMAY